MRHMFLAAAVLLSAVGCASNETSAISNGPAPTGGTAEVGQLANAERAKAKRTAMTASPSLNRAAQAHAEDMARNGYFSHTGRNGSTPLQRMRSAGYFACYAAENIARGQRDAAAVMQSWMQSDGHRRNLLSSAPREYGVGVADGPTWVMVFAREC